MEQPQDGPTGPYDRQFYDTVNDAGARSAEVVLPLVLDFLPVRSAVDVGCGTGIWASTLSSLGVSDVLGVDGAYVPADQRKLPHHQFSEVDIASSFVLDRKFDLAMCLEVAEHLPAGRSNGFVADLARCAPAVLFSAATPGQGGTHHVNEQWPDYWVERFEALGWSCWDVLRPRLRYDERVAWIYRQNVLLALSPGHRLVADLDPAFRMHVPAGDDVRFEYVARYLLERKPSARQAVARLGAVVMRKLRASSQ